MSRPKQIALALVLGVLACEGPPSAPGQPGQPSFVLGPSSTADSTSCGWVNSYSFSSHLGLPQPNSGDKATFYPPGSGTARTQCGALAFDESGVGTVVVDYTMDTPFVNDNQMWTRYRRETDGDVVIDTVYGIAVPSSPVQLTFDVPAQSSYDLIAFALEHGTIHGEIEGTVQLWRAIPAPTNLAASVVNGNQPRLTWTNNHLGRSVDSTEVFRNSGAGYSRIAILGQSVTQFTDAAQGTGIYQYFIRHVTAHAFPENVDVYQMTRPNSPTTAAVTAAVGVVAPSGLSATAVSATQINLVWTDNSINETGFQVWRSVGGGAFSLRATKSAGVTSHQDTGLLPETVYSYKVRAFNAADTSLYSNTASDTTPSAPPLVVGIDGPDLVRPGATCTWFAEVSGGVSPYTLEWGGFGEGTDWTTTVAIPSSKAALSLTVTDAVSTVEGAALLVFTNASAPICDQ